MSLARIPATSAGEAAWPGTHAAPLSRALTDLGRHLVTAPIELVPGTPMATASRNSSTKASAKCMNDPASSTMARCQPGLRRNERGSSAGSTSSSAVIPVIFTNPPNGSAFNPYSVSPRIRDHRVWPKPTKNWVTFMWNFLAVRKCPASCSMTETSRANTKITTPSRKLIRLALLPAARQSAPCASPQRAWTHVVMSVLSRSPSRAGARSARAAGQLARPGSRPAIRGQDFLDRGSRRTRTVML